MHLRPPKKFSLLRTLYPEYSTGKARCQPMVAKSSRDPEIKPLETCAQSPSPRRTPPHGDLSKPSFKKSFLNCPFLWKQYYLGHGTGTVWESSCGMVPHPALSHRTRVCRILGSWWGEPTTSQRSRV